MDHIFGDSHDITFGNTSLPKRPPVPVNPPRPPVGEKSHHVSRPSLATPRPQRREQTPSLMETLETTLPLQKLLEGMKPTFLPKDEDMSTLRLVVLSDAGVKDPLFLLSTKDESLLIGTGFGTILRAGKLYPTFPDMRLISSEKSKIQAWILPEDEVNEDIFQAVLPLLDFPPLCASRVTIAKFRENIKDEAFLSRCRFFELFPSGQESRRLGDFECTKADESFSLRFRETTISFAQKSSIPFTLFRKNEHYTLATETIIPGEIITLKGKSLIKNPLKFTFDTFYLDAGSVGLVAGYTLGDRELLAENGVLTFTLEEDKRLRTIVGHIFIDSRGFVHAHEMMSVHKEILKGIRSTYEKCILENPKIERAVLVQSLRREITKYCYLLTKRTPVVLPILIER